MEDNTFMSIIGIGCIILFSLIILILCYIISNAETNKSILGFGLSNRSFSTFQATCALISTWVCGGYFFGTRENIVSSDKGFIWTQLPWAYAISFILDSILFCELLYETDAITVFDPIFRKFGSIFGTIISIPSLFVDLLWTAISFSILKNYLSILLGFQFSGMTILVGVCVAVIAIMYGMTSQKSIGFICFLVMFILSLVITISYSSKTSLATIRDNQEEWLGTFEIQNIGEWLDQLICMILGGSCLSTFYQHFLSCRSFKEGYATILLSCFGILFFGILACILAIILSTRNWSSVEGVGTLNGKEGVIFCYSIEALDLAAYFKPLYILFIVALSFGALFGSIFSFSTVIAVNIYKEFFKKQVNDTEVLMVWKIGIVCSTIIALILSFFIESLPSLFILMTESLFIIVFPQLLLTLWFPRGVNIYGAIMGFITTVFMRFSIGIEEIGIEAWWSVPYGFPYSFVIVLIEMCVEICISKLFYFFVEEKNCSFLDILNVFSAPVPHTPSNRRMHSRSHSLKIIDV